MRLSRLSATMLLNGAMNVHAFPAYVEQMLVSALVAGNVVIMDNLITYKADSLREAIEAKDVILFYIPP
ncbi:MAG: transposase [Sodalis sp. (in: enterobacteria)]